MMKRILVIALLASSVIVFLGCDSLPKKNTQTSSALPESQTGSKFSDVPVPLGLRAVPEESYSFESSGVRVGVLRYRGKANIDHIENFYKEQMPMYNWSLINVVEYGQRLLNFERENESCIVTLDSRGKKVTVTISLGPKSQNLPKKTAKPVK